MLTHKRQLLKNAAITIVCIAILGGALTAQSRRKQKGPRAIGIVEITPQGRARLIPVGILVDGKWYDAGIYMANPRPMALEPETVYEGEKTGTPQGLFTVSAAQELAGNWVGVGTWKPTSGEESAPKKAEPQKSQSANPEDDEAPPILRRPGSAKPGEAPAPPQPPQTASKPGSTTSAQEKTPSPSQKPSESAKAEAADDPNRPVLRRGKPAPEQADDLDITTAGSTKPGTTAGAKSQAKTASPVFVETLAAISDATPSEPRSFTISLNPADREQNTRKMMEFASQAIRKFAVTHPVRGKQVPNVTLTDIQARDFDVNGSNDPVLVLTARAPEVPATAATPKAAGPAQRANAKAKEPAGGPAQSAPIPPPGAGFEYYVTIVARVDVNGEVRKLFESVTDTSHLDAIPRLQLIDCVDADGNRVGELLFREIYDRSRAYVIYRVGMDKLWDVFETAQMSFSR